MTDAQRVDYSLRLLGDCLDIRRTLIEPNLTRARDYKYFLQLGYYAAGLQHVFFLEGCACLALASFGAHVRKSVFKNMPQANFWYHK